MNDLPMTEPIAERVFTVAGESQGELLVQIGRPTPDTSAGGDWYCPVRIAGLGKDSVRPLCGVDALQALQFAMGLLELLVKAEAKGAVLTWDGYSDLGLEPWIPEES